MAGDVTRHAVYDMAGRPCTYDVVPWLATVGAIAGDDAVHVVVLADRFRRASTKDLALTPAQKCRRVANIIVPAVGLLPGAGAELVTDPAAADAWRGCRDALKPQTLVAEAVRRHAAGRDVRRLRAVVPSPHPGAVVFTIRQSPAVPRKDSALDQWLGAASVLMAEGLDVVLVPDTAAADGPLPEGFRWCRQAATDLHVRAALYQQAACSLSMGVGPMAIAMHMPGTRYAVLVEHRDAPDQVPAFERVWGVRWGEQLPFAGPGQRIVYARDDQDVILDAWRSLQLRAAA